jgi:hypothetical protein
MFNKSGLVAHNNPEININESPGKKKPTNNPVSANTTNIIRNNPPCSI